MTIGGKGWKNLRCTGMEDHDVSWFDLAVRVLVFADILFPDCRDFPATQCRPVRFYKRWGPGQAVTERYLVRRYFARTMEPYLAKIVKKLGRALS